jgi:anti-anti-sigma regulatory factor
MGFHELAKYVKGRHWQSAENDAASSDLLHNMVQDGPTEIILDLHQVGSLDDATTFLHVDALELCRLMLAPFGLASSLLKDLFF